MTILEQLSTADEQVVDFTISTDKKILEIREGCDYCFYIKLNKEKFGLLIEELKDLHKGMKC